MKKITVLSMGMCAVLALASCGTSKESAYKKAYEKAQQQEQQAAQAPVAQEPVVAPLETQEFSLCIFTDAREFSQQLFTLHLSSVSG